MVRLFTQGVFFLKSIADLSSGCKELRNEVTIFAHIGQCLEYVFSLQHLRISNLTIFYKFLIIRYVKDQQ